MIDTLQSLLVTLVAILPGALYTYAYERQAGAFGDPTSDRLIRFFTASSVIHGLFAGVYVTVYRRVDNFNDVKVCVIELVALGYLLIPLTAGFFLGRGVKKGQHWALVVAGHSREPRAWDRLWGSEHTYLVLVQMKSGAFLGGLFEGSKNGLSSYASGFDGGKDLYLSRLLEVNPETGEFKRDEEGAVLPEDSGYGALIDGSDIEVVYVKEVQDD